jgi:uroporphyrinogen III methyltransferase/synthase
MGVGTLAQTVKRLIRYGRPKGTPCAVIEWGTLPNQRTIVGTLATIVRRCEQAQLKPPAIVVVGEVVKLRRSLRWFEHKPLFGRRIVVTRPSDRAEHLASQLEALGAEVMALPAIELAPIAWNGVFQHALRRLDEFDWVFFTSPEGIRWFQRSLTARRKDLRVLLGKRIGAIGPKTAASIQDIGIHVDFVPQDFSQEGMLDGLQRRRLAGKRALILSAQDSRDVLEQGLKRLGMDVLKVPLYRATVPSTLKRGVQRIIREPVDLVTVTSSSCVEHLASALKAAGLADGLRRLRFASIGPVTSATVRQYRGKVVIEAKTSTVEGLVEAIVGSIRPTPRAGSKRSQ